MSMNEMSLETVLPRHAKFISRNGRISESPDNKNTWKYTRSVEVPAMDDTNGTAANDAAPATSIVRQVFHGVPKTLDVSEQMLVYLGVPKEAASGILKDVLLELDSPRYRPQIGPPRPRRCDALSKIRALPHLVARQLSTESVAQIDDAIQRGSHGELDKSSLDGTAEHRVLHLLRTRVSVLCDLAATSEEVEAVFALRELRNTQRR
ncbi:hypothetical protein B0J18DRAFT_417036 [Chaetomium sp. MPI-SDFR-AT-0129]|nr:hypothetical protein B0J18DRAFT_417036 [Chaetomium sp. MPI-SDFR-AT-0129]